MELHVRKSVVASEVCDILVVDTLQGKNVLTGFAEELNQALGGMISQMAKEENFSGKANQLLWVRTDGKLSMKRILIVGLGKSESIDLETVRLAAATALLAIKSTTAKTASAVLFAQEISALDPKEIAHAMTEGIRLANYSFARYKKEKKVFLRSFDFIASDGRDLIAARKGLELGTFFAEGTVHARDLVNTSPHHMTPHDLVAAARTIAKENKNITVKVFDTEKLKKMGAGGIVGVAQGSEHPPFLVHMTYTPTTKSKKRIALIGKGVTFDSGGLSIKPADGMMTMKCDMGGAADVLGVFSVIAQVAPKVEVHGIFATVENMPGGNALRPGDVIEMINKKTVEVLNTDAEGRLILADALVYAEKLKPDFMIDLATLTGACVVALGEEVSGVMSNDSSLANKILSAASAAGEKMWELPLEKNYKKLIQSDIADIKNIGGRWGGALTAVLFLQEFVEKTPWAHLDIAGPAFAEHDYNAYERKGATGHGVRTLLNYLLSF